MYPFTKTWTKNKMVWIPKIEEKEGILKMGCREPGTSHYKSPTLLAHVSTAIAADWLPQSPANELPLLSCTYLVQKQTQRSTLP